MNVSAAIRSVCLAMLLGAGLTACPGKPCTAATVDAGCPAPVGECVDAGAGLVCPLLNQTCGCCLAPAYECTLLQCGSDTDGGRAWQWVTSIAPPECRPGS